MTVKMEEEQMDFLDELLDGVKPEEAIETQAEPIEGSEPAQLEPPPELSAEPTPTEPLQEPAEPAQDLDNVTILREQIVKLTEQLSKDPLQQAVKENVSEPANSDETPKKELKLENFLTAEELDRVIDEPDVLNKAFGRAISVIEQNIQGVIQAEVNRQIMVSRAVTDFYTANQDLAPYNKFVQFVMAEVEKSNPDKTYAEIFSMTANETRKRLGLGQSASAPDRQKSQTGGQRPAFAGSKKSTARPASKQEFFDPNAADMLNLL